MKKHLGLLSILLAIPLFSGCNPSSDKPDDGPDTPVVVPDWNETQKEVFSEHLYGYELPFIENYTATYDSENACVVVQSDTIDLDEFEAYLTLLINDGFSKQVYTSMENAYIMVKELSYDGKDRTIEIDIFYNNSVMYAICYDPFIYEWPTALVTTLLTSYIYPISTAQVPSLEAKKYYYDASKMESDAVLVVYAYSDTNLENEYALSLQQKGFTVSNARNENGYFEANDTKETVSVLFGYDVVDKVMIIVIQQFIGWPATEVDYYTAQFSETTVPAVLGADEYAFIDCYDAHGYFYIRCEMDENYEDTYAEALSEDFVVYNDSKNTAGNYWAVSDDQTLMVQYLYFTVDSPFGGKTYKEFSVMFEPYFPHDGAYIAECLQTLVPGTTTVLPTYPGYGENVSFSDSNIFLTIKIQACTYDSFDAYLNTLRTADWNVTEIDANNYNYAAVSPNRDIRLETSYVDGRIVLTLQKYEDAYSTFPVEGVNEILASTGLTGTIPSFDNALGFDYENGDAKYITCLVKVGQEADLIAAYEDKLIGLGWTPIVEENSTYFVKAGQTAGLVVYTPYSYSGIVFIDIIEGDATEYDIDARAKFNSWKKDINYKNYTAFPGLTVTQDVNSVTFTTDSGVIYEGNELLRITLDIGEGDKESTIAELKSQLVSAEWTLSDDIYIKDDFSVKIFESDGKIYIDILAKIKVNNIYNLLRDFIIEEDYIDVTILPDSLTIVDSYVLDCITYDLDYVKLVATLEFESSEAASAAKTSIKDAFIGAEWTVKTTGTTIKLQKSDWISIYNLELTQEEDSSILQITFKDSTTM